MRGLAPLGELYPSTMHNPANVFWPDTVLAVPWRVV